MTTNNQTVDWERIVALERREAGHSWKSIARYFVRLSNMKGLNIVELLMKEETAQQKGRTI